MSELNNNQQEGNQSQLIQNIPQEQLISHLRSFFFSTSLNNNTNQIQSTFNLHRSYSNIQNEIDPVNNEDLDEEDKDDNENNNDDNGTQEYQQLNLEEEGMESDSNELVNNNEEDQDEDDYESPDELNVSIQEEIIDFRLYPLQIDWYEIENTDNNYFDILELYGYFGMAVLTSLSRISGIELIVDDFVFSILNHYYTSVTHHDNEEIIEFISYLPSLKGIHSIINQRMFNKKEIICMKVVLDIYEHHIQSLQYPCCFTIKQMFSSAAGLFYACLTEDEIEFIYNILSKQMKNTFMILIKLGSKVKKQKQYYINHYNEMNHKNIQLIGGVNEKLFIL